jgi:hypothetical protein
MYHERSDTIEEDDMGKSTSGIGILLALVILAGCYVYPYPPPGPPYYYHGPNSYERSWNAALDAMDDVGVRIVSSDRNSGVITGFKDGVDTTITIRTQADGRVRVEFSSRGPSGQDPGLSNRIYQAYERRMGR